MRKNVKVNRIIIFIAILVLLILITTLYFLKPSKADFNSIDSRIISLEERLDIQEQVNKMFDIDKSNGDIGEIIAELNRLKKEFSKAKEKLESISRDQIILTYQQEQKDYERKFDIYIGIIAIIYTIFVVTSIPFTYKKRLKNLKNKIKKAKQEQQEVQEKNEMIEEIKIISQYKSGSDDSVPILHLMIEKTDKVLSKYELSDFENCKFLLEKAENLKELHKLRGIDNLNDALKCYNEACKYSKKTKSKYFIADIYYRKSRLLGLMSEYKNQIQSIDVSINKFPENEQYLNTRDGAIGAYYMELNKDYKQTSKKAMDWIFKELDKIYDGNISQDIRKNPDSKVNQDYLVTLDPEKQKEYIEKGYADPLPDDTKKDS